jgi:hypothetical protein
VPGLRRRGRHRVEERGVGVDQHVPAIELGDRGGVGHAVAEEFLGKSWNGVVLGNLRSAPA